MQTEALLRKWFNDYKAITGDSQSAATLVLAHVQLEAKPPETRADNLTVKQAARQLGVSEAKVYELCDSGQLRRQKIGRSVRIAAADLKDFKTTSTQEAVSQPLRCLKM